MTMRKLSALLFAALLFAASLAACDSSGTDDPADEPVLETRTFEDLPADPAVGDGEGRPSGTGRFAFFSLRENAVVLPSSRTSRADSSSTQWDLGFQRTRIIVNGGDSGPGNAAAYVAEAAFQEVTEVEMDRLAADETGQRAIPPGAGNGWYSYSGAPDHVIAPIPGRTLVVRTADGEHYAKVSMQSYYEGAPADPASSDAASRYYTFDYVISDQPTFE